MYQPGDLVLDRNYGRTCVVLAATPRRVLVVVRCQRRVPHHDEQGRLIMTKNSVGRRVKALFPSFQFRWRPVVDVRHGGSSPQESLRIAAMGLLDCLGASRKGRYRQFDVEEVGEPGWRGGKRWERHDPWNLATPVNEPPKGEAWRGRFREVPTAPLPLRYLRASVPSTPSVARAVAKLKDWCVDLVPGGDKSMAERFRDWWWTRLKADEKRLSGTKKKAALPPNVRRTT